MAIKIGRSEKSKETVDVVDSSSTSGGSDDEDDDEPYPENEDGPRMIRVSFRKGGDKAFYAVLRRSLLGKGWEASVDRGGMA